MTENDMQDTADGLIAGRTRDYKSPVTDDLINRSIHAYKWTEAEDSLQALIGEVTADHTHSTLLGESFWEVPDGLDITPRPDIVFQMVDGIKAIIEMKNNLPGTSDGLSGSNGFPVSDSPPTTRAGGRAPTTPLEEILCTAFAEVLELPEVSINDDFFAIGGDSIYAIQLLSRLRSTLSAELGIQVLFDGRTPARLAALLALPTSEDLAASATTQAVSGTNGDTGDEDLEIPCDGIRPRGFPQRAK